MNIEDKELVLDYLHDRLATEKMDELNDLLRRSEEARAFLRLQATMDVHLRERAICEMPSQNIVPMRSQRFRHVITALTTLAACGVLYLALHRPDSPVDGVSPATVGSTTGADGPIGVIPQSVPALAVLKSATGVIWQSDSARPATGSTLTSGWLRLASGTLQIEFFSGARLLLDGPAELRLDSENSAYLLSGKASAYVPEPAQGFVLESPRMNVKDLGTSFGMEVAKDKDPEVHVFDGSVELFTAEHKEKPLLLPAAKALQLRGETLHEVPIRRGDFPDGENFSKRALADSVQRQANWNEAVHDLAKDPTALVVFHFDEENEWKRAVTNLVKDAPVESHATIVGAGWTAGRWKGKNGLEFRTLGDRLRFSVAGAHQQLTAMAWIRVDSLPNDYNSLLLPTHYQQGSLHWNIERGGEMRLTQLSDISDPVNPLSWNGPVSGKGFSGLDLGRWLCIVTTFDANSGEVIHYRDGVAVGSGSFSKKYPIVLGEMEFGNWGADGKSSDNQWILTQLQNHRVRNFVGRIDHLSILSRVMSAEEIADFYQIGSP